MTRSTNAVDDVLENVQLHPRMPDGGIPAWVGIGGSPEGETVAASGPLPHTASGWGTYDVWEMAVDREVFTGVKDVFIVFRMHETHTDGSPYVGNFRWFRFGDTNLEKDTSRTTLELESIRAGHGNLRDAAELVAEEDFSGNGLKTEGGNGGSVLAGTENGFWVRYQDVDLADAFSGQLLVTYAAPSHRVNEPSIAIYLDSLEGEPFVTAPLAITGGSWSDYSTAVIDLPAEISGRRTIYLEFRSVPIPEENKRNVGNFDAITFVHTADKSALRAKIFGLNALEVYSIPPDVLKQHVKDRVARERDEYRHEPDPTFLTHGPRTWREYANLKAWGG